MSKKKAINNPWLHIPWQDYEGHMSSPGVRQEQFLNEGLQEALDKYRPRSVAVLGCSTGNGFEHFDPSLTRRVIGVDLNPNYLEVLQDRHATRLPGLELICGDLNVLDLVPDSCELIYCGLVFEYLEPKGLVRKIARWLVDGGKLVAILQLPSKASGKVSKTRYKSLELLDPIMKLVDPLVLRQACIEARLTEIHTSEFVLESKKAFFVGHYQKNEA
jgi:SAM-dependent methyltransferase